MKNRPILLVFPHYLGMLIVSSLFAQVAIPADAYTENPGSEGNGKFTIGPEYKIDPDLTDKGNPKGKSFEFTMRLAGSKIFRGDDATEEAKYPLGAWEYHSSMKLIEKSEKKPLRVFTHVSENDLRAKDAEETPRQQNLWVDSGSGSLPNV
ncbi:MAG: hypothetical protein FJ403_22395 [Verrucomicrobia bacterium]|nr:hypothetical protein [Verrucomicrobiota bacterium]